MTPPEPVVRSTTGASRTRARAVVVIVVLAVTAALMARTPESSATATGFGSREAGMLLRVGSGPFTTVAGQFDITVSDLGAVSAAPVTGTVTPPGSVGTSAARNDNGADRRDPTGPFHAVGVPARPPGVPASVHGFAGFVVSCDPAVTAPDDPLVHPGVEGAAHTHLFVGAENVDADTTTDDLAAAATTCSLPADRSSYWAPYVLTGTGSLATVDSFDIWYQVPPGAAVTAPPAGYRVLAGTPMATRGPTGVLSGWLEDPTRPGVPLGVTEPAVVGPSGQVTEVVRFPDCWNGVDLDTVDHANHAAYSTPVGCPDTHPIRIPQVVYRITFSGIDPGEPIMLSSGEWTGRHADLWHGWARSDLDTLLDDCGRAPRFCDMRAVPETLPHPR